MRKKVNIMSSHEASSTISSLIAFNVNDKIKALKNIDFNGQKVVIVSQEIPSLIRPYLDEVAMEELKFKELSDSSRLLHYIFSCQEEGAVEILRNVDEVRQEEKVFDYVAILHDANGTEQRKIVRKLKEYNKDLQII